MNYICSRRYRGKTVLAKYVNIPAKTEAEEKDGMIYVDGNAVCFVTSQVSHQHFSRNDDGNGMLRGEITYAIAFSNRKRFNEDKTRRQRFTDGEIDRLCTKWERFLKPGCDVVLFNHPFFGAEIDELREMAKDMNIAVKGEQYVQDSK